VSEERHVSVTNHNSYLLKLKLNIIAIKNLTSGLGICFSVLQLCDRLISTRCSYTPSLWPTASVSLSHHHHHHLRVFEDCMVWMRWLPVCLLGRGAVLDTGRPQGRRSGERSTGKHQTEEQTEKAGSPAQVAGLPLYRNVSVLIASQSLAASASEWVWFRRPFE